MTLTPGRVGRAPVEAAGKGPPSLWIGRRTPLGLGVQQPFDDDAGGPFGPPAKVSHKLLTRIRHTRYRRAGVWVTTSVFSRYPSTP